MDVLHRDDLARGGFAGVREHRLVKDAQAFGENANLDGSWPGMGNFVYMADARFVPNGETGMHPHKEVDVVSVIVDGRFAHAGSLGDGKELKAGQVQVQRAGGEGFSHNEINPDDDWNRMIQLWVLPEEAGQDADYRLYFPKAGELTPVYGGPREQTETLAANTRISVAVLVAGQSVNVEGPLLAYIARGTGTANGETVTEGDLFRDEGFSFKADDDTQLIVIHTLSDH